jgi:hypothetical protein
VKTENDETAAIHELMRSPLACAARQLLAITGLPLGASAAGCEAARVQMPIGVINI